MKESFEAALADAQKEEMNGVMVNEDLMAAKEDEIESGTEQVSTRTAQLAEAQEKAATNKQDLEDTTATLKTDKLVLV